MSYHKSTLITCYETIEPCQESIENDKLMLAVFKPYYCQFVLEGHWNPENALTYARTNGIFGDVDIEHKTSDDSGIGISDARFVGTGDTIRAVAVSP